MANLRRFLVGFMLALATTVASAQSQFSLFHRAFAAGAVGTMYYTSTTGGVISPLAPGSTGECLVFDTVPDWANCITTIQDDGTALTQRPVLNFIGAGVTCVDGSGKTNCTIPGGSSIINVYNDNDTWTNPAGAATVTVMVTGGGGGGGGGMSGDPGATGMSGGNGGGGGGRVMRTYRASDLTGTVAITVGVGGVGGPPHANGGQFSAGTAGGTSSFGAYLTAYGGGGGIGGYINNGVGGGGGGAYGPGETATVVTDSVMAGGLPWNLIFPGHAASATGHAGAPANQDEHGYAAEWGGGGGGSDNRAGVAWNGGDSFWGGAGGGAGGGMGPGRSPAYAPGAGGNKGYDNGGGGAAGTSGTSCTAGSNGTNGNSDVGGTGGGGGGSDIDPNFDASGCPGGNGGIPGGGGGGAGAGYDTTPSIPGSNGGNGGKGQVIVITTF